MTLTLPVEAETYFDSLVASGRYATREAAILGVIETDRERAREAARIMAIVQPGLDDVAAGRVGPFDMERHLNTLRRECARLGIPCEDEDGNPI